MVMPDLFIDHDSQVKQIVAAGLSAKDIVATALDAIGIEAIRSASVKPASVKQVLTAR